jgi:hypothetical protein
MEIGDFHVFRQRGDHVFDEILAALKVFGDRIDIVAIGREPLFRIGDLRGARHQGGAFGRSFVLRIGHRSHAAGHADDGGTDQRGGADLQAR